MKENKTMMGKKVEIPLNEYYLLWKLYDYVKDPEEHDENFKVTFKEIKEFEKLLSELKAIRARRA